MAGLPHTCMQGAPVLGGGVHEWPAPVLGGGVHEWPARGCGL